MNPRALHVRINESTKRRKATKTFFEHFLDEVARKHKMGETDQEKAQRWIANIRRLLQDQAQHDPTAPIVQMPVSH